MRCKGLKRFKRMKGSEGMGAHEQTNKELLRTTLRTMQCCQCSTVVVLVALSSVIRVDSTIRCLCMTSQYANNIIISLHQSLTSFILRYAISH